MSAREQIIEGLKPMFEKARELDLWFHCNYQDLWFSPDELAAEQARGSFVWGAQNWELRDPKDQLMHLGIAANAAQAAVDAFRERLSK